MTLPNAVVRDDDATQPTEGWANLPTDLVKYDATTWWKARLSAECDCRTCESVDALLSAIDIVLHHSGLHLSELDAKAIIAMHQGLLAYRTAASLSDSEASHAVH